MSITLTLVLVVTFSVAINAAVSRLAAGRLPMSGSAYLVTGLVIGPYGLRLLDADVMVTIQPFVALTLGIVGFHLGLGLKRGLEEARALEAGFLCAAGAIVAVGGAFFLLLDFPAQFRVVGRSPIWIALTLGAAAAAVSVELIQGTVRAARARGPVCELLRSFAFAGNVAAVSVAGVGLALSRARQSSNRFGLTETEWLLAAIALGAATGLLFAAFVGRKQSSDDRLFLATVGIVVFTSGLASATDMSPLLLNAISGFFVSMASPDAAVLHDKLDRLERPAVLTLMIFAGATWQVMPPILWLAPLVYVAIRFASGALFGAASLRAFADLPHVDRLGGGLFSQGSIAVAVVLSHAQVYPDDGVLLLGAVLTLSPVADALGAKLGRQLLIDEGEADQVLEPPEPPELPEGAG